MKVFTANKANKLWKDGMIPSLEKKLDKVRVLKTKEQVQANTNSDNIPSAVVVGELINNLAQQPTWIRDSTGKITGYKTSGGADTVFPFYNMPDIEISNPYYVHSNATINCEIGDVFIATLSSGTPDLNPSLEINSGGEIINKLTESYTYTNGRIYYNTVYLIKATETSMNVKTSQDGFFIKLLY